MMSNPPNPNVIHFLKNHNFSNKHTPWRRQTKKKLNLEKSYRKKHERRKTIYEKWEIETK